MKRWNTELKKQAENANIDNFLKDILKICKKYNFSISHEDQHGSFQVTKWDKGYESWLLNASDSTDE